jgi:peptidyl-prolyl cis-trans isomerase D
VADQVFECDGMFVVVALKDVYKKGYATLDQARPMIEQQVRLEKKAKVLMDRAASAVNAAKDIQSIAVALKTPVDTLDSVVFGDMNLQKFGMEPKVISAIAVAKNGVVGPVKGSNGVYVVQVDGKMPHQTTGYEGARMAQMYQYKTIRDSRRPWPVAQVLRDAAKIVDQRNKFF